MPGFQPVSRIKRLLLW